jgi:hypothetical protein
MKLEQTQCSETSAIKHHTPGNNPKDYTQHLKQGESFKSIGVFVGFSRIFLLRILIFKGLTARHLNKSVGVKGLT